MKIGHELESWLKSESLQTATMDRVAESSRLLRSMPEIEGLDRELRSGPPTAEHALSVGRRILAKSRIVDEAMRLMVRAAKADIYFRPPLRHASTDILNGIWLYDGPRLSLFLAALSVEALAAKRVLRSGRASVAFTGQRSIYRFIKAGRARLSLWEAPEIDESFTREGSGRCRRGRERRLKDGDIVEIDGRREGFVIEEAEGDIVYLQAITPLGAGPLMVEYDADNLGFVSASSTDEASSRTQMMLSLLRIMERTDAAPVFEQMLESAHFYARWQTMREFLALDAERALPFLRQMAASDTHSEVRAAARDALSMTIIHEAVPKEPAACLA